MRGKKAPQKKMLPDPVYQSGVVTRFINYVMLHGKKSQAQKYVYGALDAASKELKKKPLEILELALKNTRPTLEVRSRRVGGASYQVPVPVADERQVSKALRWIISCARAKEGQDFEKFLTIELVSAYKNEGEAVKKKQDTEKMAEANKAFAHFRW